MMASNAPRWPLCFACNELHNPSVGEKVRGSQQKAKMLAGKTGGQRECAVLLTIFGLTTYGLTVTLILVV